MHILVPICVQPIGCGSDAAAMSGRAGPQLSIDHQPELRKQEIHHPASHQRLHSAKIRCALSIDRQSRDGCGERLQCMRIERKVVRPAITRHSAKIALECVRVDQNYRSLF